MGASDFCGGCAVLNVRVVAAAMTTEAKMAVSGARLVVDNTVGSEA